jgi:hypothetical protein
VAAALALAVAAPGCRRGAEAEQFLTYYGPEHALSLRYPASWKSEQIKQGEEWLRYFSAPPAGTERKPAVSVLLVAIPAGASLDATAQAYLSGLTVSETRDEERPGARGKTWSAISADGKTRQRLLLLQEENRVYGLHAQGEAAGFEEQEPAVAEMIRSFSLERWALYTEERNDEYRYSLRVPPTWKSTRTFSGGGTHLKQFTSPAFGMDKGGQTVHASLIVTAETVAAGSTAEAFFQAMQAKLGENFQLLSHSPWKDGYVDLLRTETPMAESRGKRFYRVADGRGYTLAFEARADVYPRVSRWCDMIAATLKAGAELEPRP